jgi:predicted alpha/beta-fold hydrolase
MNIENSEENARLWVNATYTSPWWLPGGHLQTIYPRALGKQYQIHYRRERWPTPDGDFIDLDWVKAPNGAANLLVLFHGLEGSSHSHYAVSLMAWAQSLGWRGVVPHFRGCGGDANRLPRSYHSGDSAEIDWILRRLKAGNPDVQIFAVAVSLGANMFLKWLGEQGDDARQVIAGAAAISAPFDLLAAANALDSGHRKLLYTRHFLTSMRQKIAAKISQHQLKIDTAALSACSTFRAIDELYTAPVHGFKNAVDYWTRSSSKRWLKQIRVPTLLINARNDPFLPSSALPDRDEVSPAVTLDFPAQGGHVGFVSGNFPGTLVWLPRRIGDFFLARGA